MDHVPNVLSYTEGFSPSSFWRVLWPEQIINMHGFAKASHFSSYIRDFVHYANADVVLLQKQKSKEQLRFIEKLAGLRKDLKFRLVYETDDVLFSEDCPEHLKASKEGESVREMIDLCDELVVSTPFLEKYYRAKSSQKAISVLPNFIPKLWFGGYYSESLLIKNYQKHRHRPRIAYAGSLEHFPYAEEANRVGDFSHIEEMIAKTSPEFQWVFMGRVPVSLRSYVDKGLIEVHPFQSIAEYPKYLASLEINMMIAPLADTIFNRGRSDLKLLEASALGLPIACQDLPCYERAPIRFTSAEDLLEAIKGTLSSGYQFQEASRMHYRLVQDRWLENPGNLNLYRKLFSTPFEGRSGEPLVEEIFKKNLSSFVEKPGRLREMQCKLSGHVHQKEER